MGRGGPPAVGAGGQSLAGQAERRPGKPLPNQARQGRRNATNAPIAECAKKGRRAAGTLALLLMVRVTAGDWGEWHPNTAARGALARPRPSLLFSPRLGAFLAFHAAKNRQRDEPRLHRVGRGGRRRGCINPVPQPAPTLISLASFVSLPQKPSSPRRCRGRGKGGAKPRPMAGAARRAPP